MQRTNRYREGLFHARISVLAADQAHTFATTLLDEGAPVEQIQPAVGHEDVRSINGDVFSTSGQQEQPNEGAANNPGLSWPVLLMLMGL